MVLSHSLDSAVLRSTECLILDIRDTVNIKSNLYYYNCIIIIIMMYNIYNRSLSNQVDLIISYHCIRLYLLGKLFFLNFDFLCLVKKM